MKGYRVGYVRTYSLEDASYIGGLMITDNYGIPLEFKYTEPIKPTKIQKILYGQALEKYIKKEVILLNLLNNTTGKPDVLVTPEDNLTEFKNAVSYPVINLERTSLAPLSEVGVSEDIHQGEFILQASPSGSPLRIKLTEPNPDKRQKVETIILELGKSMDLIEPLIRVEGALKAICQGNLE